MKAIEAFETFLAVREHFKENANYDFFKYHGRFNRKGIVKAFEKRREAKLYHRIAKEYNFGDWVDFLSANYVYDPDIFIIDLTASNRARDRFLRKQSIDNAFDYWFAEDLKSLFKDLYEPLDAFKVVDGQNPPILHALYTEKIHPETFIALDDLIGLEKVFSHKLNDFILWPEKRYLLQQYRPFMRCDVSNSKEILLDVTASFVDGIKTETETEPEKETENEF